MKEILKSKMFIGVFLLTYFSFFFLTIYVWEIKSSGFGAGWWNYGFPFTYYGSHCFGGYYLWSGLLGNILFAGILSAFGGAVLTYLWGVHLIGFYEKVTSDEFRAKWYLG